MSWSGDLITFLLIFQLFINNNKLCQSSKHGLKKLSTNDIRISSGTLHISLHHHREWAHNKIIDRKKLSSSERISCLRFSVVRTWTRVSVSRAFRLHFPLFTLWAFLKLQLPAWCCAVVFANAYDLLRDFVLIPQASGILSNVIKVWNFNERFHMQTLCDVYLRTH